MGETDELGQTVHKFALRFKGSGERDCLKGIEALIPELKGEWLVTWAMFPAHIHLPLNSNDPLALTATKHGHFQVSVNSRAKRRPLTSG